jgi:hypothetical protein
MVRENRPMYWPAIVSAIFCSLLGLGFLWVQIYPIPSQDGNLPLRTFKFRLSPGTRDLFFVRMCLYGEVHGFKVHIGATDPNGHGYNVIFERADVLAVGVNPWDDLSFDVGFHANPGFDVSDPVLDALVADLRATIDQIPGSRALKTLQDS